MTTGLIVVVVGFLVLIYGMQIVDTNSYLGYLPIDYSSTSVAWYFTATTLVIALFPKRNIRPSDMFLAIYCLQVLIPCIFFAPIVAYGTPVTRLSVFMLLVVPALAAKATQLRWKALPFQGNLSSNAIGYALVPLLAIAVTLAYSQGGTSASWDWEAQYERRLEGRSLFEAGSLLAYLLTMCGNGLAPFLAFIGALRRKALFLAIGLCYPLFSFFILGIKAQVLLATAAALLGLLCRMDYERLFPRILLLSIAALGILSLIEMVMFSSTSFVAETFFRRAFVLPGVIQSYFYDFILNNPSPGFETWFGKTTGDLPITFVIGKEYFDPSFTNANSNAFLVALAQHGIGGYIFAATFSVALLIILDRLYFWNDNKEVYFVALIYSVLICEQAFTIALVSSGVGLLLLLVALMKRERERSRITGQRLERTA